jgi:hypothetical protein
MTLRKIKVFSPGFLLFISFLFLSPHSGIGQDLKIKSDTLKISNDHLLEREVSYRLIKNDTTIEGRVGLTLRPLIDKAFSRKKYIYQTLEVPYKKNKKEGEFNQHFYEFSPDFSGIAPNNGWIQMPYNGLYYFNKGSFQADKPNGEWEFFKIRKEKLKADTLSYVHAILKQGQLDDKFVYNNYSKGISIEGEFAPGGLVDRNWKVSPLAKGDSSTISYEFLKGRLVSISNDANGRVTLIASNAEKNTLVDMDSMFLEYLKLHLPTVLKEDKVNFYIDPIGELLKALSYLNLQHSKVENYVPKGMNFAWPKVELPVFELSASEKEVLEQADKNIDELAVRVHDLLDDPALKLNKANNKELSMLFAKDMLLKRKVDKAKAISDLFERPVAKHIDRKAYVESKLAYLKKPDTTSFTILDETFEQQLQLSDVPDGLDPFEKYLFLINDMESRFEEIEKQTKETVRNLKRNKALVASEKVLFQLSEDIENIVDTLFLPLYNMEVERVFKNSFLEFKRQQLQGYLNLSAHEKAQTVDTLITCMERVIGELHESWDLVRRKRLVDQTYMDMRLNPYTYTKMSVRLHEKLFQAYYEKVIPYVVFRIMPVASCEEFLERVNNIEVVQDFMLKVKKDNPRKLERQFRRGDSPELIIQKLNIPVKGL